MISCVGQVVRFNSSLRSFGLGVNSKNFADAFSFSINPAAVVKTNGIVAGVYSERKYFVDELSLICAALTFKKKMAGWGIEIHRLKWSHYSHTFFGIAYGRTLGRIDLGIRIVYENVKIAGYSNSKNIGGEVGGIFHLSEKVNAGFHFSISGSKNGTYIYGAGIGYEVSDHVFVGAAISQLGNAHSSSNVGLIYRPARQFKLKAGLITEDRQPYFSAGWIWKDMTVEIVINYHAQLGVSPGLLLSYQTVKKHS